MGVRRRASSVQKLDEPSSNESRAVIDARDLVEQAEVCCREARMAARMKRLRAACGLFETAQSLLKRAVALGGNARAEASEKLSQIATESAIYAELCRDHTRRATPKPVAVRVQNPPRS